MKSKPKSIKMSEYILPEIQEEILKRLPVKPLVQFRSVSKPWKSLIDSPKFTGAYGRQTRPNRLILRYNDGEERFLTYVDNDDDHTFIRKEFAHTVPDLIKSLEFSRVVGSSHGLLCFKGYYKYPYGHSCNYHGTDMVVLWNPSVGKSIGIEVLYIHDSLNKVEHVIGFGVCPVTFDPTIVKIEGFRAGFPLKVGVFSLSTGSWSILSTDLSGESIRLAGSQVVIGRFIYWLAFDVLQVHYLIMSFDFTAKEFKAINLPYSLTNRLCSIHAMSKLRESLVLIASHKQFEQDVSVFCLWMMKEQGVSRSFTKLYTINQPDATIMTLLGFRKTGELILETQYQNKENSQLEIYSPTSKAIDNLEIDGHRNSFFMCSYMETLFLLHQLDGFIYSISDNSLTINKPPVINH